MLPFISTPFGELPTFTLLAVIGVLAMIWGVYRSIDTDGKDDEAAFIFPRIVVCGLCGFASAGLTDSVFKYIEYGELRFYGITFYGGLIGAIIAMYIALTLGRSKTRYTRLEWFNRLIPPFIVFHICGRIGCFLGGCCYGRYSQSVLALAFPDNPESGIFHYGQKCLPTQLFEAVALVVILFIVVRSGSRLRTYLYCYAPTRFCLEFLRGDDRGNTQSVFSPSQLISVLVLCALLIYEIRTRLIKEHRSS